MNLEKIIAALCYFSFFFLGLIFPLIVWLVSADEWLKGHAKAAFISHIIPMLVVPLVLFAFVFDVFAISTGTVPFFVLFVIVLGGILSFFIMIWNVYKGIKVLL
ncbi:DUF4870 domain-containing protein [Mangrovibacillus cuniculi]|uniref:DUF4870 domain-containing protein n=1 Tax=Mangrovibacillus cuniculi TaxID=2593652 RepID=A0A7S8CCT0_9BACI|nr:DUF4870 domain-containing protein [Mangrovibacillus cuniculi]QPC47471.1 DUF4870 domain-containing protein [Mangrovibacillus cuniculi]